MRPTAPPESVVKAAIEVAKRSPCAKSKRGVVIYQSDADEPQYAITSAGFNGPPGLLHCDGSDACRRDCPKICMHAEERAMLQINRDEWVRYGDGGYHMQHLDLVHVKVVDGELVPGGGPSCWQCSRTIYDALIGGVWLFEEPRCTCGSVRPDLGHAVGCWLRPIDESGDYQPARWRRYSSEEFHRLTLAHERNKLHAPARR